MRVAPLVFVLYAVQFSPGNSLPVEGCKLNLTSDLPKKNDPVYLVRDSNGKLQLDLPDLGAIDLINLQDLVLACTGSRNSLVASGNAVTETTCSSGTNLVVSGKVFPSAELNCSSRSAASLLITKQTCVDANSFIIQSGFPVSNDWFPLVDTCHNIDGAASHWSRHILYGSRLPYRVIQSTRPGFSRGDDQLYKGFNPDTSYSQANQEEVFARIYGKTSGAKYIVKGTQYSLSRGHLSPDADFLFGSWQMLTYFFVNVAPQWQIINAGNWLAVENNARKLAINLAADIEDVTGTYKVLSLADDSGVMREAYLEGNRLPVPELFWKLLSNPKNNSCIVLVTTNNPYLTSPPKTICPDICLETGWPILQKDLNKGYVYCCNYESFKAAAPQVPEFDCRTTLNFK